jgi:aminopeptidase N
MQKQLLLIPLTFLFVIFSIFTSSAQKPKIDMAIQKEFLQQKAKHYQQLYSVEQQKTANQDDYDVRYYSLDLTPDPTTSILSGQVEVVAEVISPSLDHVELNFWDGMTITDIHRTDSPDEQLNYTHTSDLLSIDLHSSFTQGEEFRVVIGYNGKPQNSGYYSFDFGRYGGEPMIGTLSEPFGARVWWPCKDVNSDKADSVDIRVTSVDIRVTVPNDLIVASNGTLRETTIEGDLTTYWWHEQYPIATYLVSIAIHPYRVYYEIPV